MSANAVAIQKAPETKGAALKVVQPETLFNHLNRIHNEIERRAFEIFQGTGGFLGHEIDNWFKAETELFHPVKVNLHETENELQVEAEVPGFDAKDLEVSVEPEQLTIVGKRETTEETKKGKAIYKEQTSNEIFRVLALPAEVDAAKVTANLKNGVLNLTLPKTARAQKQTTKVEVKAV
jgi:HSP20 family protein